MVVFLSLVTANNSSASIVNVKKLKIMKLKWHIVAWSQKISYKFGHCFRTVQEKKRAHTETGIELKPVT